MRNCIPGYVRDQPGAPLAHRRAALPPWHRKRQFPAGRTSGGPGRGPLSRAHAPDTPDFRYLEAHPK
jgi:hypothetical protein